MLNDYASLLTLWWTTLNFSELPLATRKRAVLWAALLQQKIPSPDNARINFFQQKRHFLLGIRRVWTRAVRAMRQDKKQKLPCECHHAPQGISKENSITYVVGKTMMRAGLKSKNMNHDQSHLQLSLCCHRQLVKLHHTCLIPSQFTTTPFLLLS